jgi:hypothetical protein
MERANDPIGSIQRILGYENRGASEICLHSIGDAEREAMAIFEQARGKVSHRFSHRQQLESGQSL